MFTSIVTNSLFAQERVQIKNKTPEIKTTEVKEILIDEETITEIKDEISIQEIESVETELSKEQLQQIAELDELLKSEKISQEEYDKKKEEIIGVKPVEPEMMMSKSAMVEPESQTLGKYIAPSVSTSNGSLNYSYPIVVPTGRNGLTPDISLAYNSSNKSHSSIVGTGWSFNIPYIQRTNKTGTNNLYSTDSFTSSLDGELIDQGNGIYTPRTENGSFLKYEYSNDTWTVTDKTGTKYQFGTTTQARQDNSADTTQIFSWMLETVTDTNGNTISYSYFKDQGQIYPNTISYNQEGLFNVSFLRTARTNSHTEYSSAFKVKTAYVINKVEVSTDNSVTATYDITTTDNLVKDITVAGFEGASSFELPPAQFEYHSEQGQDEWKADPTFQMPLNSAGKVPHMNYAGSTSYGGIMQDVNGDNLPDVVSWYRNQADTHTMNEVYMNGNKNRVISEIENSNNGKSSIEYKYIRSKNNPGISSPLQIIELISTDDNNGNTATTSYEYRDADYYYNNPTDKKFAGFGSVTKTDDNGTQTITKYHQANGETGNEPTDSYTKIGKVYEQRIENSSNDLFILNRTNYTETSLGNDANSIQTESQLSQQYDGTSSYIDTATSYIYNAFGNATKQTQYGIVSGNTDGTFSDTGTDKRTTDSTYTNNTTDYIVGLPMNQTLKDNSGAKSEETNYSYDSNGNLLIKSNWISGSDYSDTTYTYNTNGTLNQVFDAFNNETKYRYNAKKMYPSSVTNALGHKTNYTYDLSSGKVKKETSPNGKVTSYKYDGLDRLTRISKTFANGSSVYNKKFEYNTTVNPQYTKTTTYTGTDTQKSYSYTDGFGQTTQTKSEMDSGWLTLDTVFDVLGRTEKQSLPYQTSSSNNSNPTSNNNLMTSFGYDALGRVLSTTNAKGTTSTNYDGFETTITDALSSTKDLVTDAFGNLITVKEHNGGSIYTTNYDYNIQNLLTKITDAENNERDIAYDGLGRRTSLQDLHTSSDSTFGTWNFIYDDMNLTSQTDPKNTTTLYSYDNLNRVLTENNTSTTRTDISYTYDVCSYGKGNVCSITTPDITTNYTYLKQGLVDTENKTIDLVIYTTNTDYNRQGNITKITHPNASYTEYEHNKRGLVDNVKYNGTSYTYDNNGNLTHDGTWNYNNTLASSIDGTSTSKLKEKSHCGFSFT